MPCAARGPGATQSPVPSEPVARAGHDLAPPGPGEPPDNAPTLSRSVPRALRVAAAPRRAPMPRAGLTASHGPSATLRHRQALAGHDLAPRGLRGAQRVQAPKRAGPPSPLDLDDEHGWPSLSGHARTPKAPPRANSGASTPTRTKWLEAAARPTRKRVANGLSPPRPTHADVCVRPPVRPRAVAAMVAGDRRPCGPEDPRGRGAAGQGREVGERPRSGSRARV